MQKKGDDGEVLSLDETISKWLDANKAVLEPTNSSCSMGNIVNGISKDLGFSKYLERYVDSWLLLLRQCFEKQSFFHYLVVRVCFQTVKFSGIVYVYWLILLRL